MQIYKQAYSDKFATVSPANVLMHRAAFCQGVLIVDQKRIKRWAHNKLTGPGRGS